MENILLIINIILAAILVVLVLFQKSEGGALGIGVSQDNFMLSRSAGNFLTKATAIIATLFIICSLCLTILSRGELTPTTSVLDKIEETDDAPKVPDSNNKYYEFLSFRSIRYFHGAIYLCHWRRGIISWKRIIISITCIFIKVTRL